MPGPGQEKSRRAQARTIGQAIGARMVRMPSFNLPPHPRAGGKGIHDPARRPPRIDFTRGWREFTPAVARNFAAAASIKTPPPRGALFRHLGADGRTQTALRWKGSQRYVSDQRGEQVDREQWACAAQRLPPDRVKLATCRGRFLAPTGSPPRDCHGGQARGHGVVLSLSRIHGTPCQTMAYFRHQSATEHTDSKTREATTGNGAHPRVSVLIVLSDREGPHSIQGPIIQRDSEQVHGEEIRAHLYHRRG